jgi:hypothetical protein
MIKKLFTLLLLITVGFYPAPALAGTAASSTTNSQPVDELLKDSFLQLLRVAPELDLPDARLDQAKDSIEEERDREKDRLEKRKDFIEEEIDQSQEMLKSLNESREDSQQVEIERHRLHCKIQDARKRLNETELKLDQGIENKYDILEAKVNILKEWPDEYHELIRKIEEGKAPEGKFADFRDVGFRGGVFEGQDEDVKDGREAVDQLKRREMLPPEIEDEEINAYVRKVSAKIGRHSDLRVPLKVTVLRSQEVNAFALPGGYLFINSGLIEKAQTESELAGVIAHEISHVAARHADRLMGKANISNIIFQAAQIAAMVLTGGVSSMATYYLLQYGFYGLGMALNLALLGVSRDYETEADILGTQYLWHANYKLTGFVDFFQRMAEESGYITGLSWFRTHPPFADRMKATYKEMLFLPDLDNPVEDTETFHEMKDRLSKVLKEMEREDSEAPTLRRVYDCGGQNQDTAGTTS